MSLQTSPQQFLANLPARNFLEVFSNTSNLSIAYYQKNEGLNKARALLVIMITDLVNYFNVGQQMTALQVAETATQILEDEEYICLTIADFKLCFSLVKRGKLGDKIFRIDGRVIFDFINEYMALRSREAQRQSIKEAESYKMQTNSIDKISGAVSWDEWCKMKKERNQ
ncbi:MAG: hypothetical protein Q8861_02060 [Bacteroidota bacterium]|nr:hypothetical protein [Bacteroidota bacterium]